MAKKDNTTETEELVFEGMPGADAKTEEDVAPFQVDMNFEEEEETQDEQTEEEASTEEATEEVAETEEEEVAVEEPEATTEEEPAEELQTDDEQPVEPMEEAAEVEAAPEVAEVEEVIEEEPKAPMVPKSRLDEVLAKNKEMQKKLQDIEKQDDVNETEAPQYDFVSKEKEYQDLVLEGQTDAAAQLRNEIRTAERAVSYTHLTLPTICSV